MKKCSFQPPPSCYEENWKKWRCTNSWWVWSSIYAGVLQESVKSSKMPKACWFPVQGSKVDESQDQAQPRTTLESFPSLLLNLCYLQLMFRSFVKGIYNLRQGKFFVHIYCLIKSNSSSSILAFWCSEYSIKPPNVSTMFHFFKGHSIDKK